MLRKITQSFLRKEPPSGDDGRMDFDDGPIYQKMLPYDDSTLEALALETIIAPSLQPMQGHAVYKEQLMLQSRRPGQSLADAVKDTLDRRPSAIAAQAMAGRDYVLLRHEVPPTPMQERGNPFDDNNLAALVTPMPKRPPIRYRPVSFRTRRDPPLRVQTLRRNHQAAFVQRMMQQIEAEITAAQQAEQASNPQPMTQEAWRYHEDMAHWHQYTPQEQASPPVPHTQYTGPRGETITVYKGRNGRTYV